MLVSMGTKAARRLDDPTVYPVEERVGEESLQRFIVELLRPLIERYLAERGVTAFTGADQFVYFVRGEVRKRVAPDVYVLPGVRPGRRVRSWKTWVEGVVPSFALEVVSQDVDKDYIDAPPLYDELGVSELVIFDPDFENERGRQRFQVYRRLPKRGLVRVQASSAERVASKVLGCHLVAVGAGEEVRLRLGIGAKGEELYPSVEELLERERADKARERADKERERAGRLAAEDEVRKLRARLKRKG